MFLLHLYLRDEDPLLHLYLPDEDPLLHLYLPDEDLSVFCFHFDNPASGNNILYTKWRQNDRDA